MFQKLSFGGFFPLALNNTSIFTIFPQVWLGRASRKGKFWTRFNRVNANLYLRCVVGGVPVKKHPFFSFFAANMITVFLRVWTLVVHEQWHSGAWRRNHQKWCQSRQYQVANFNCVVMIIWSIPTIIPYIKASIIMMTIIIYLLL